MGAPVGVHDAQNPESMLQYADYNINSDLEQLQESQRRLPSAGANPPKSANDFVTNNTYIKHQKLVTYKKKED